MNTTSTDDVTGCSDQLEFLSNFEQCGNATLDSYQAEISTLLEEISSAKQEYEHSVSGSTYRGKAYGFGGMRPEVSTRLYGLVRYFKPQVLVETGVCNGVSTAVILAAMRRNGSGDLYSIDLPEFTDTEYTEGDFWEGKGGAAVPKQKQPGWIIPDALRDSWSLILGSSRTELPPLLDRLEKIDFFLHDSEHSYECMMFEYDSAWNHLVSGGILVSDDLGWNTAFKDFAVREDRISYMIDWNMAFIVK